MVRIGMTGMIRTGMGGRFTQYIAENLLESCKEPLHLNDQTIYFSFSVGIALSQFASSPEDFIMQADQAMYKAKTSEQHWFIYKPEN